MKDHETDSQHHPEPPESGKAAGQGLDTLAGNADCNSLDWLELIPNGTIFAYNVSEAERPGGMKVRWKVRVATGTEAARWDARQAEAITEVLTWLTRHPPKH